MPRDKIALIFLALLVLFVPACSNEMNVTENSQQIDPTPEEVAAVSTNTPEPSLVPTESGPAYQTVQDLAYLPGGNRTQRLDVFIPLTETDPPATILMFHGGGGKRGNMYQPAIHFAEQGYQVVVIGFRDYPDYLYPVPLEDVFCAVAWMGANKEEYGFRMDKLVGLGHSFGGTLASSLAVVKQPEIYLGECEQSWHEETKFIAVVPFTGIFDYVTAWAGLEDYATKYLGGSKEDLPEIWTQASPVSWVEGQEAPFMLIHGQEDGNIPPEVSEEFAGILKDKGVMVRLEIVEGKGHTGITQSEEVYLMVDEFLTTIIENLP